MGHESATRQNASKWRRIKSKEFDPGGSGKHVEVRSGVCDSLELFAKLNASGGSRSARSIGNLEFFSSIHETATHLAQSN
jgi:hypothetical protein